MIKAVIFDIGDVLVNFGWREFLEKSFDDPDLREELAREVFEHETWGYCDSHDLSLEEEISAFASHAPHLEKEIRYILTHMSEFLTVYPYTHAWIRAMKEKGYKVYFLSNYSRIAYEQTKDNAISFIRDMDGGLFSYREQMAKPDPAFFKLFCERYQYKPEEILFFDDMRDNVHASRMLGMQGIRVNRKMMEQEVKWYKLTSGGKRDMLKVVKFGGSSLADSGQFEKVKAIVEAEEGRRYVIPSAPGKRSADDTKITDMLYTCYEKAQAGEDYMPLLDSIKARYDDIINGLGIDLDLTKEFKEIKDHLSKPDARDYTASRGEYLNGLILAEYLGIPFIDAAEIICFNAEGVYQAGTTKQLTAAALANNKNAVIPGFYGADRSGQIHTFSRGGSDITGAIIAGAVGADIYENWTDVSGVLIADPGIVENAYPIDVITYRELRELSYMGAAVLHEDAIFPVKEAGIPINIRNTNKPEDPGTLIVEMTCRPSPYVMTGVAGKKGFVGVTIEKERMNDIVGYCRAVLGVFAHYGINIEHMPSGIDTMSVFVHQDHFQEFEQKVLTEIKSTVEYDHIELENDVALIAVVGRGMRSVRGTAGRIFSALAHANVNVRMIDQGSSELNIIIGVHNQDFETAIKAIYSIFVDAKKS